MAETGEITSIKCFYCPEVHSTITSLADIVVLHKEIFFGWDVTTNYDSDIVEFRLKAIDGVSHTRFDMFMENKFWHSYLEPIGVLICYMGPPRLTKLEQHSIVGLTLTISSWNPHNNSYYA